MTRRSPPIESGRLGYGVRVNCVYPGLVPTDMGMKLAATTSSPLGLFAVARSGAIGDDRQPDPDGTPRPRSRRSPIRSSSSAADAARFMTGTGLPIDGGMGI